MAAGYPVIPGDSVEGYERVFVFDPFGNRIELLERFAPTVKQGYNPDLAYVHDVGFSAHACQAAPDILEILKQNQICDGLVVDLGCGSGWSALAFTQAGYRVLGIDLSEPMLAIARSRVPEVEFRAASLFQAQIPACQAVTAIGECLNYQFDATHDVQTLPQLFQRIYNALSPGGVFIFDLAEPGQVATGSTVQKITEGEDWVVLVTKTENQDPATLTRRITTFRQIGEYYRREDEIHTVRLYRAADVAEDLRRVGFQVQLRWGYGQYDLPPAHAVFVACKPL